MATPSQISANRENAQHSTGPTTEAGKEISSHNNFRHGLTGHGFSFLDWENPDYFEILIKSLRGEHRPASPTESILIEKMAQHHWLSQRALTLQMMEMKEDEFDLEVQKRAAVFARYQIQHERQFERALNTLLKLRAERRKEQIGFESQKQAQAKTAHEEAREIRREFDEKRKAERHKVAMAVAETRLQFELARIEAAKTPPRTAQQPREEAKARSVAA